jgi:hypothetical protein
MESGDYPVSQIQLRVHNRWLEIHPVIPVKATTIFDLNLFGKILPGLKGAALGPTLRILKYKHLEGSLYRELLRFGNED